MTKHVSPELYQKYKKPVLEMSLAVQYYEGAKMLRETSALSDREIAERLGLDERDVTEIRCIAELESLPADTWRKSADWKRKTALRDFGQDQG